MRLSKTKLHFLFLSFLVGDRETEKGEKKGKKTIKIVLFKVVIQ